MAIEIAKKQSEITLYGYKFVPLGLDLQMPPMSQSQHTASKTSIILYGNGFVVLYALYKGYFNISAIQANIRNSKEKQFQESFLRELFVKVWATRLIPASTSSPRRRTRLTPRRPTARYFLSIESAESNICG
jgi:hypothetical protein